MQLYFLAVEKHGCPPAGAVGALAAFQAVQGSSEAQLLRLLGDKASAILEAAKHLNWLPDQPPRTALGHSPYIQDLLPFLKVWQCTQTHTFGGFALSQGTAMHQSARFWRF